jgi:hypothetical protein
MYMYTTADSSKSLSYALTYIPTTRTYIDSTFTDQKQLLYKTQNTAKEEIFFCFVFVFFYIGNYSVALFLASNVHINVLLDKHNSMSKTQQI